MKAMNKNVKVKDFSVMKRELRELVKQKEKKEIDKYVRENLMKKRESISDSLNLFIYIQELGITAHLCYHFS